MSIRGDIDQIAQDIKAMCEANEFVKPMFSHFEATTTKGKPRTFINKKGGMFPAFDALEVVADDTTPFMGPISTGYHTLEVPVEIRVHIRDANEHEAKIRCNVALTTVRNVFSVFPTIGSNNTRVMHTIGFQPQVLDPVRASRKVYITGILRFTVRQLVCLSAGGGVPATVGSLAANTAMGDTTITWTTEAGVTGAQIDDGLGGAFIDADSITQHVYSGLGAGTYNFKVKVKNAIGYSPIAIVTHTIT